MSGTFEAPHGDTENTIAQLWAELLGVDRIGRQDDFFELGGHSVLGMGMLARLRKTLKVDLSMTELFRRSKLAAFAEAVATARAQPVAPAAGKEQADGSAPLSPAQERIWFMEQMTPGTATYHLHWAIRLTGPMIPAAMEQALREVQRRHDVLRTAFVMRDGNPVQIVKPYTGGTLDKFDLSALAAPEREAEIERLALENSQKPFDLQNGPPLRVYFIKLAADEWVICLNMHHLVSDGWSLDWFFRDLKSFYSALIMGEEPQIEPLQMQYGEFARRQLARQSEPEFQADVQFWKRQLRPPLQSSQLETDFPRPEKPSYEGHTQARILPQSLVTSMQTLCREEGVTLFMALVATLQVLLHRYHGKDDIVLGTDVANRGRAGHEPMLGLFVNQIVLRTDLSGQPTFREVLRRVRRVTVEAFEHQDVPFDHLVRELAPSRSAASNPLFQVMVLMHSATPLSIEFPRLRVQPMLVPTEHAPFDLTVSFAELTTGGLFMGTRYRTDLFRDATMASLMNHIEVLLAAAAANPDSALDELDMLPAGEAAERAETRRKAKASKLEKLLTTRPREVDASPDSLVALEVPDRALPLIVTPRAHGVVLDRFARTNARWVEEHLNRHGALLFRGFGIDSGERLNEVTSALTSGAMDYSERSSPRTRIVENVFTSTDHPPDQPIVIHNEQSYTLNWPMKILFCCVQPAATGGNTPIADSRKILARLKPATVAAFERKGVTYVRNYGSGAGLSWREAFQTEDQNAVEAQCRASGIEFEWHSGDRLRTRQRRAAIHRHPVTNERVWFNHAFFFNVASLERETREAIIAAVGEDDVPYQTRFGDDSRIGEDVFAEIREALAAEAVPVRWQRGDLLLADNMLVAHGREPYTGERRIAVAMAEPYRSVAEGARSLALHA